MKKIMLFCLLSIAISVPARGYGDILIVVNQESSIYNISERELIDLYMGRRFEFSNGETVLKLDQGKDSDTKRLFYQLLIGKTLSEVTAYWARLLFTGRSTPPYGLGDDASIVNMVMGNKSALGYVNEELDIDVSKVKVVGRVH